MYGITPSRKLSIMISNLKWESRIKEWVVFNKLEDFHSLLKYTDDDFTPSGDVCHSNDNREKLHQTTMQELYNLKDAAPIPLPEAVDDTINGMSEEAKTVEALRGVVDIDNYNESAPENVEWGHDGFCFRRS